MSVCNINTPSIKEKLAEIRKYYESNMDNMTDEQHIQMTQLLNDVKEGVTDNLGNIYAQAASSNNIQEIESSIRASSIGTVFDRTKVRASTSPTTYANLMTAAASVEQGMKNVFRRDKYDASRFLRLVGFDQLLQDFAKMQKANDDFQRELGKKLRSYKLGGKFKPLYRHFTTIKGANELGIIAHLIKINEDNPDNFSERKAQIYHTIAALSRIGSSSNGRERVIQEIVDDMGLNDIKTRDEFMEMVQNRFPQHLEMVNWTVSKYQEVFQQHADISREYFNIILKPQQNYTPDTIQKIDYGSGKTMYNRSEGELVDNLLDNNFEPKFMRGPMSRATEQLEDYVELDNNMFHSFDFVLNNSNKFSQVLKDIYLTPSLAIYDQTLNSEQGKAMLENIAYDGSERSFIKNRLNIAVKNMVDNRREQEVLKLDALSRLSNRMAKLAAVRALGRTAQVALQVVPAAIKTMAFISISSTNAAGTIRHMINSSPHAEQFLQDHSTAAYRGVSAQADVSTSSTAKEESYYKTLLKAPIRFLVDELGEKIYLDNLLVKPDRFVAKRSWLAFYAEHVKNTEGREVNWSTEKANKDAIAYANSQVSTMMNASIYETMGTFFTTKSGIIQFARRIFLPFASMQQNNRNAMYSAAYSLFSRNGTMTSSDKYIAPENRNGSHRREAAAIIAANLSELIAFNSLRAAIGMFMKDAFEERIAALVGLSFDMDDEDDKMYDNLIRGFATSLASDLSPLPVIDQMLISGINGIWNKAGDNHPMVKWINREIFNKKQDDLMYTVSDGQSMGMYDVVLDDFYLFGEMLMSLEGGQRKRGGMFEEGERLTAKQERSLEAILTLTMLSYFTPSDFNSSIDRMYKRIKYYRENETRTFEEVLGSDDFKTTIYDNTDF